jgi:hypothetical protein
MEKPFRVVVTGDSLAPQALEILSAKCRVVFSGPYPQPLLLARRFRRRGPTP